MLRNMLISPAQLWRGRKPSRGARIVALSVILTTLIAAGLIVGLRGSRAQSGGSQPDYSNVDDFLNGGKHLLRDDDLVMTFNYQAANNETRGVLFTAGMNNSTPTFLNFDQRTIPQGPGCPDSAGCNYDYHQFIGSLPATGRFFNTVRDTTVHYPVLLNGYPYLVSLAGRTTTASPPAAGLTWTSAQSINFVTGGVSFLSAVGDFNGDGFDDLVMAYSNPSVFPSTPRMCIATAVDVNDPSKGFKFGPEFSISNQYGIREITIGDFNGDRQPEIASLFVAADTTLYVATYRVDSNALTISDGGQVALTKMADTLDHPLSFAAGRFTGAAHQQIFVGVQTAHGKNFNVHVIDFDPNSVQPKLTATTEINEGIDASVDLTLKLEAGRFNWSNPYDQIAWMETFSASGTSYFTRLSVLTVDPGTLAVTKTADIFPIQDSDPVYTIGFDIAVGNFDHLTPSAADPTKKERNPDLQIALIGGRTLPVGGTVYHQAALYIYDVSEDFSTLTQVSRSVLDQSYFGGNVITDMSIAAGDLQGRSMRLGAGYKVTVDRTQPSVVLAAPPMHIDYVSPGLNKPPTVLNLSVAPDGFKSEYTQTQSADASVTQTDTTSSSFAGEESLSGSLTLGQTDPFSGELENGVKITDAFTAKQDIHNSADTLNGAFNSSEFEVSQETGFSDVVWFKDTSYYLYVYPVIGRKVCPADKPNCQENEKNPLQIMFSAPKATTVQRTATDTLEWYQPPWEFGNIFSYPAGLAQLKQYIPDISLLTADTTVFATDDAGATLKTTWANGKTTGQTIEHEALFSESNDLSIEGATSAKILGVGGSKTFGLDLNFGGSNGVKSLNESDTRFSSAQGITISKSAAFSNPFTYKYFFSPYIFGKVQPVGFTDSINSTADLLTFGTLRSAFTVDPLANGAGAWWSQSPYRQFSDVAVNHPNRWSYARQPIPSTGVVPSNCVALDGLTMNCITPTEREPENPWGDPFHDMRGLFITNAANPPNSNPFIAGGGGAQLETATAGDKLTLSTRVYNYSFKTMPAGTKVKVRFYGMQLDDQNLPVNPDGGSFLIGETVLAPISPFNNDPSAPLNWVLASTTFDTTGRENQALCFWVAVWMEDASGNLVQEVTSHGLTGAPTGATPTFNAITTLEEMVDNPLKASPDDPAKVSFSNNIGFYRSAFHILPKTTATATGATATSATATVKVEKVDVSAAALKPGRSVEASATLRNGAQELLGVMVYFYDGDPAAGGKLVDIERVARLRAGRQQKVSIRFRPQVCGVHRLFVRVAPGKQHATSGQAAQAVQVDCPTPVCVSQVCMRSAQYHSLNLNRLPQGMVTVAGKGIDTRVSTSDTARMRMLLQGGTAAQQKLNQQYVATQLSLLGQPGGHQAALRSNLLCYKLNFQPTQLGTGVTLNPSMTLGELFDQVQRAGRSGKAVDQRLLANLLNLLNGDDPQGRCR